jgi:DNA-binding transcriptional MocR family regulator
MKSPEVFMVRGSPVSKTPNGLPLYRQLAEDLKSLMHKGTLRGGDRMPSIRKLTQAQKVSPATVMQAYSVLENEGLIEAKPKSGFYVKIQTTRLPPVPSVTQPSRIPQRVQVCELVERMYRDSNQGFEVDLGAACPDPELMPSERLFRIMSSEARKLGPKANTYSFPPGYEKFRREIARRSLECGVEISPDEVVVTAGAVESIHLAFTVIAKPGGIVAIETPTYFNALQSIQNLGMKALEIATSPEGGISLAGLEKALQKYKLAGCFVMSNAQNPTGTTMPDEKKKALVELLAKYRVPLIEDDVNGDIYFGASRPIVCKAFDKSGTVILCNSYSKTISPGFRVGWIIPGAYQRQVENLKFITTAGSSLLLQATLAEFLRNGGYDRHLRGLRKHFFEQVNSMSQSIARYFPAGTRITRPQGGTVLWIELPESIDSISLYERALKNGISICPGPLFSGGKGQFKNFIRIACGYQHTPKVDKALRTLGQLAGGSIVGGEKNGVPNGI